mmetsp:Transcript_2970/g.11805  ORF Transcript_2970/g.11805 Transcript_2970/m.11805 type:complete len:248 (+) Transcript_2970:154-897(+)
MRRGRHAEQGLLGAVPREVRHVPRRRGHVQPDGVPVLRQRARIHRAALHGRRDVHARVQLPRGLESLRAVEQQHRERHDLRPRRPRRGCADGQRRQRHRRARGVRGHHVARDADHGKRDPSIWRLGADLAGLAQGRGEHRVRLGKHLRRHGPRRLRRRRPGAFRLRTRRDLRRQRRRGLLRESDGVRGRDDGAGRQGYSLRRSQQRVPHRPRDDDEGKPRQQHRLLHGVPRAVRRRRRVLLLAPRRR